MQEDVEVDVMGPSAGFGVDGDEKGGLGLGRGERETKNGKEEKDEDVLWAEDDPDDDRDWVMKLIMITEEQEAQYLEDVIGIRKDKRRK